MTLKAAALILTMALCTLAGPLTVGAQPPPRVTRIGLLWPGSPATGADPPLEAFLEGLRERGYIQGQNLAIEARWAEGRADRLPALASELVRENVDLIIASTSPAARAARQVAGATPIVAVVASDPAEGRALESLARPGGNLTGVTREAPPLTIRLLELLKELLPGASRVAMLRHTPVSPLAIDWREAGHAARGLRVKLLGVDVRGPRDFESAFADMARQGVPAVIVPAHPGFSSQARRIAELAAASSLPAIYELREFVDAGGLMSYGPGLGDLFRRAAGYAAQILQGVRPADLLVEPPRRYELVINLAVAKALGIAIPVSLLLRADHLIE